MEKAVEKQTKATEDQGKKQGDALKVLKPNTQVLTIKNIIPEDILGDEAKDELNKIKEIEKTVVYLKSIYTYSYKIFQTIKTFG